MSKVSCRTVFTSTIEAIAANDETIYMVCTDSRGSVTSGGFAKQYPGRFIEAGIAEQNAISIAAGLSTTGKNVFVAGPACFLSARGYEQIKTDIAYNQTNVKIIGVSAGVSYGPLGGTHTTLHDFAGLRALPNIEIFAPSDGVQAAFITRYLAKSKSPAYMRMGRGDVDTIYGENETFDIHKAKMVKDGTDVTLIACGEMVSPAIKAAEKLEKEGISTRVLDMFCIKPPDIAAILDAATQTKAIVTIEEHSVSGGLGELVCAITAQFHPTKVRVMAFPDEEYKVGKNHELFEYYGLTPGGIAQAAKNIISE